MGPRLLATVDGVPAVDPWRAELERDAARLERDGWRLDLQPKLRRSGDRSRTQDDPIGLAGAVNLYGFTGGDPVSFGDPFGLATCPPVCGEVFSDLARRLAPLENALNVVGEVSGVNNAGRAGHDIAGGHPIRGGISIAMALPGGGSEGRLGAKLTQWVGEARRSTEPLFS